MSDIERDTAVAGELLDPIEVLRQKKHGWLDMEELDLPGWRKVVTRYDGGYSWDFFGAWYDSRARVFYWHVDSGCSCNGPSDEIHTLGDFMQGGAAALVRAYKEWASEEYNSAITAEQRVVAERDIRAAIREAMGDD